MTARESQHHVVDFFSADSNSRGEMLEKESSPFQQALRPTPLVALSLRTRESSALVCKQIFDQIYSSAESNPNNNNDKTSSSRTIETTNSDFKVYKRDTINAVPAVQGGRNITNSHKWQGNSFSEEHRISALETDTAFTKVQTQASPSNDLAVISSPLVPLRSQSDNRLVQQTSLPQGVARPSLASTFVKQPTAELTIFYAGTVNVYEDVPADRADAIMLLAGTGHGLHLKQCSEGNQELTPTPWKSPCPPAAPPLHVGPISTTIAIPPNASPASPSIGKAMGYSAPPAGKVINILTTSLPSPSTPLPAPSLPSEPKPQAGMKRPQLGIELPHARKASLARFLEKRKDRIHEKHQHMEATPQNEEKVEEP